MVSSIPRNSLDLLLGLLVDWSGVPPDEADGGHAEAVAVQRDVCGFPYNHVIEAQVVNGAEVEDFPVGGPYGPALGAGEDPFRLRYRPCSRSESSSALSRSRKDVVHG